MNLNLKGVFKFFKGFIMNIQLYCILKNTVLILPKLKYFIKQKSITTKPLFIIYFQKNNNINYIAYYS